MRRAFIIAAIVIVVFGLGIVGYFIFFPSSPSVVVTQTPSGTSLPVAGSQPAPQTGTGTGPAPGAVSSGTVPAAVAVTARLAKISSGPVVFGEAVVDQPAVNASSTPDVLVNFIDRQSGNIFGYSMQTHTLTRTSNRTVPGIQSAAWVPNGTLAFVRYLTGSDFSLINTYALFGSGSGGFFLPQGLADVAVASTSVLTLASGVNGSTVSLSHIDGSHTVALFSTPLSSIRIAYAGKTAYLVTTKAASDIPGDAFLADSTGHFTRIAGPLDGLAALPSPLGKWVFVTYIQNGMQSELVNPATGEVLPLPLSTIADKCVWAADDSAVYCGIPNPIPSGTYPDDWYQGVAQFSDQIWKIDVNGRFAQLVDDVSADAKTPIDVTAPALDKNGSLLVFVNKNDGSLWAYSL